MARFYRNFSNQLLKTLKVTAFLSVMMLMVLGLPVAQAQPTTTTQPGIFFTIQNGCSSAASGFAVGDKLCLLQIGTATYTRAIFQGTLAPGEQRTGMACTGSDGNGKVIFVPSAGTSTQAVVVAVTPNSVVKVPESFCSKLKEAPQDQFKQQK